MMSKSNPVGREIINPMSVAEYENRKTTLMDVAPIVPKDKSFKEYFLSKLDRKFNTIANNDFAASTFYHFEMTKWLMRKDIASKITNNLYTVIPFNNIAIKTNIVYDIKDGGDMNIVIKFNVIDENTYRYDFYSFNKISKTYIFIATVTENLLTHKKQYAYNSRDFEMDTVAVKETLAKVKLILTHFLITYMEFEPIVKETKISSPMLAKAVKRNEQLKERFKEYILDLNKPRTISTDTTVKGTHARPCEHIRRPHQRRLRNGEVRWFGETVVNKGVGKATKKEYKL